MKNLSYLFFSFILSFFLSSCTNSDGYEIRPDLLDDDWPLITYKPIKLGCIDGVPVLTTEDQTYLLTRTTRTLRPNLYHYQDLIDQRAKLDTLETGELVPVRNWSKVLDLWRSIARERCQ